MPKISQTKQDKIAEHILHYLYEVSPKPQFTATIADHIARDEEFTKSLLLTLKQKKLIVEISKNPNGIKYKRRKRWRLSNTTFEAYAKHQ